MGHSNEFSQINHGTKVTRMVTNCFKVTRMVTNCIQSRFREVGDYARKPSRYYIQDTLLVIGWNNIRKLSPEIKLN
jgi:hypothetical protein